MKALVVYESMFGNTEQIARAVADGLGESVDVQLTEVAEAPADPGPDVALIVAGGPTHAFSMSRENTRADAISKGAHEGEREFGLREWMAALPSGRHTEKMATFDTKIKVCATCPDQPPKVLLRLLTAMATSRCRKRRASMSTRSTVRCSTVRLIGHELGPAARNVRRFIDVPAAVRQFAQATGSRTATFDPTFASSRAVRWPDVSPRKVDGPKRSPCSFLLTGGG
jgi:Flavodoxin